MDDNFDYLILSNENQLDLQEQIVEKMKEGYIPTGGVQVVLTPGARFFTFFQAVYKDDIDWELEVEEENASDE